MYSFKYIFSLGSAEKLFESRFGIQIIRYFSLHPSLIVANMYSCGCRFKYNNQYVMHNFLYKTDNPRRQLLVLTSGSLCNHIS